MTLTRRGFLGALAAAAGLARIVPAAAPSRLWQEVEWLSVAEIPITPGVWITRELVLDSAVDVDALMKAWSGSACYDPALDTALVGDVPT